MGNFRVDLSLLILVSFAQLDFLNFAKKVGGS